MLQAPWTQRALSDVINEHDMQTVRSSMSGRDPRSTMRAACFDTLSLPLLWSLGLERKGVSSRVFNPSFGTFPVTLQVALGIEDDVILRGVARCPFDLRFCIAEHSLSGCLPRDAGTKTIRHNDRAKILASHLNELGVHQQVRVEDPAYHIPVLGPDGTVTTYKGGDVVVTGHEDTRRSLLLDLTIADPHSANPTAPATMFSTATSRKVTRYARLCRAQGWDFAPYVVSAYGAYPKQTYTLLHSLFGTAKATTGASKDERHRALTAYIAEANASLWHHNALAVINHARRARSVPEARNPPRPDEPRLARELLAQAEYND